MFSSNVKQIGLKIFAAVIVMSGAGGLLLSTPAPAEAQVPGYVLRIANTTPYVVTYDISFDGGYTWTQQSIRPGGVLAYNTSYTTISVAYYRGGFDIVERDVSVNTSLNWFFRPVFIRGAPAAELRPY